MDKAPLFKHFLRAPSTTGTLLESSKSLARLITELADLSGASMVVELGPGTGVITERILRKLSSEAQFFALEINEDLVEATRRRCPGANIYHDSASEVGKYLQAMGSRKSDRIISGLPWAFFPREIQKQLLEMIVDSLVPGGKFLTYAYLHGMVLPSGVHFRKRLERSFSSVHVTRPIWKNVPPAVVYCAER